MPNIATFSVDAAKKIKEAVGTVLGQYGDGNPTPGKTRDIPNTIITAKLTSRDGTDTSLYAWTQAIRNGTGYDDLTATGLSGTVTTMPAIDPRVQALRFDMTNKYVQLAKGTRRKLEDDGEGGTTTSIEVVWYVISFPPIVGMYQFMTYQNATDSTVAMQAFAAHPDYT